MIQITRRLHVGIEYVNKFIASKNIIENLFDAENLYTSSLLFTDEDINVFIEDFLDEDNMKFSYIPLNSQGRKYIDTAYLVKAPYKLVLFVVGNRIILYGTRDVLGQVKEFTNDYLTLKENDLETISCNPILKICKLSSKQKNDARLSQNSQEININEESVDDNQTRTVSGFSEFVHNGKQSLNETGEDETTIKKRRFIIKRKK